MVQTDARQGHYVVLRSYVLVVYVWILRSHGSHGLRYLIRIPAESFEHGLIQGLIHLPVACHMETSSVCRKKLRLLVEAFKVCELDWWLTDSIFGLPPWDSGIEAKFLWTSSQRMRK